MRDALVLSTQGHLLSNSRHLGAAKTCLGIWRGTVLMQIALYAPTFVFICVSHVSKKRLLECM